MKTGMFFFTKNPAAAHPLRAAPRIETRLGI
jgi:hypothetical protein